jgi:hypothetical protein
MIHFRRHIGICAACACLSALLAPGFSRAQHAGDVLVQSVGAQIITMGKTADQPMSNQRTFHAEFDESFSNNNPGFNSLATGNPNLPAGVSGLPANTPLGWDFSSMRIDDLASNLFYWNGAESDGVPGLTSDDVRFGPPPTSAYRLYMKPFAYFVDGADAAIPGGVLVNKIEQDGTLHVHEYFGINDGDGNGSTDPAVGIYLMSIRLRMSGMATSLPTYLVFGTLGLPPAVLDSVAVPWVAEHEDTIVLLGDYNKNGIVDSADYTVWRNSVHQTGFALAADGDASGGIGMDDYHVWRDNYGKTSPTSGGQASAAAVVPEPSAIWPVLIAALPVILLRVQRSSSRNP